MGVTRTVSSSWMSALRKALVMPMLDHVVSGELDRLSINRSHGASRFAVAVECSSPCSEVAANDQSAFMLVVLGLIRLVLLNLC